MSRPKVKAKTKDFVMRDVLPVEHRHKNYLGVIARMHASGICSKRKAIEMKKNVDDLYGEASE